MPLIKDILESDNVFTGVSCGSKKDLFDTAAGIIADCHEHTGQQEIFDCLCARERLGSTDLGNGMALPHGRLPDSGLDSSPFRSDDSGVLSAFLILDRAIDYDARDRQPVDLVFVLITPEHATDTHLAILALLAETLGRPELVSALRAEPSSRAAYALLTGSPSPPAAGSSGKPDEK